MTLPSAYPFDIHGMYLTPEVGVGTRLNLDTIDRRIAKLPLRQSLDLISKMCFLLERSSPTDFPAQQTLTDQLLPAAYAGQAKAFLSQAEMPCMVLSPQILVLLGIRVLAFADESAGPLDDGQLVQKLGSLCLALGEHCVGGEEGPGVLTLEIVRLGLFYAVHEHPGWLSLTNRIFLEQLPLLAHHPDWMDPHSQFEIETGLTIGRFWAITAIQGSTAGQSDQHFQFPINFQDLPIAEKDLANWKRLTMSPVAEARKLAIRDSKDHVGWSMNSVWKRPLIDVGNGRGPILRAHLLAMQAEPAQMFWHIRDALVARGIDHDAWARLYGAAVELSGLAVLRQYADNFEVLSEDDFVKAWQIPSGSKGAKRADAAMLTTDNDLIVMDFVARQFTRDTRATGDFSSLEKDLRMTICEKLPQIDSTLVYALESGITIKSMIPIVVTGGPLPMNPLLTDLVNSDSTLPPLTVIGRHADCRSWIAMDLLNLELLLRIASLTAQPLVEVISAWQESAFAGYSVRDWSTRVGPGTNLPRGGLPDDWMNPLWTNLGRTPPPLNEAPGGTT